MLKSATAVITTILLITHVIIFWGALVTVNWLIMWYKKSKELSIECLKTRTLIAICVLVWTTFNVIIKLTLNWVTQTSFYIFPLVIIFPLVNIWVVILFKQNFNFFITFKYFKCEWSIPIKLIPFLILIYIFVVLLLLLPDLWHLNYYQWDV